MPFIRPPHVQDHQIIGIADECSAGVVSIQTGMRYCVINYFYPRDVQLLPAPDPFSQRFGQGARHPGSKGVKRLVEMEHTGTEVHLVDTAPILLKLLTGNIFRNWEEIARWPCNGFLLITNSHPDSILGFV